MIWINLGIIVLALIGFSLYGFLLYRNKMKKDLGRVKRLSERFEIRINVIQNLVNDIKQHIDQVNSSVRQMKAHSVKVKDETMELKQATVGLTREIKRTAGIDRSDVSTETKI